MWSLSDKLKYYQALIHNTHCTDTDNRHVCLGFIQNLIKSQFNLQMQNSLKWNKKINNIPNDKTKGNNSKNATLEKHVCREGVSLIIKVTFEGRFPSTKTHCQ